MNKEKMKQDAMFGLILFMLLLASIASLILIKQYVGYVGVEIPAEAGTITEIKIDHRQQTVYWAGVFGLIFSEAGFNEEQHQTFGPGDITSFTLVFNCFAEQDEQEIYASLNSTIADFGSIQAGTWEMIDLAYLNISENRADRANNTFANNVSILIGSRNVSGIPGVYSYSNSLPGVTFFTGILNDSGRLVMVGKAYVSSQASFKNTNVRYQMLLPTPNASKRWYFFSDPNDECPAGLGVGQVGDSIITGFVFESNSTTPIQNALVTAGANSSYTDASGLYNFTVPGGRRYDVLAMKEGYITNMTNVNTSIGATTRANFTLARFHGFLNANASVVGHVIDNSTGTPLSDVTVTISGAYAQTNGSGNYSLNVSAGNYSITATRSGYLNHVGRVQLIAGQNLTYIINLTQFSTGVPLNGTQVNNGTIAGYVRDNSSNAVLQDVAVSLAGITNYTNSLGFYNISSFEGSTNLVATKSGYNVYAAPVNITAFETLLYNFSMTSVTQTLVANGSLTGTVRDSSGSALSDVNVFIVGLSDASDSLGFYNFSSVPAGTHVLAATKTGYVSFVGIVNITSGAANSYNFTMETTTEAGLGPGNGPGQGAGLGTGLGAGLGAGRGPGTGLQSNIEQPIEIRDYDISINRIVKKVRYGTFISVPLVVRNNRESTADVRLSIEGDVRGMIQLDNERLSIDGGSAQDLEVTVLGNREPGVYEGALVFSGDIEDSLPIYILVLEKERVAIETLLVKVSPEKEKYSAGSDFKFRVDMQNLLSDESYKIKLDYTLESIRGNKTLFLEEEEVAILTSFTLLKKYELPKDLPKGSYKIKVRASFLDFEAEHFAIFTVREPFYYYKLFGIIPLWTILAASAFIGSVAAGIWYYRKKQAAKKRYQIKVDYNLLPKPGPRTAYAGMIAETMNKTYLKLDQMQLHTLIAGSTGSGKSVAAQVIVEEALAKGVAIMVFDPTAQWTGFLRKSTDKKMLALYPRFGLKKTDARAFNGNIRQILDAREIIDVKKYLKPGEINVFTINKLDPADADTLVANTIRQVFHANLPESPELRLLLVFDEVHRLLPKFGGSGQGFLQIERALREFRKWGVGLVLISQVLKDFIGETKANINTTIQMRSSDETDLNRIQEDFGEKLLQSIVKAPPGTGMIQNSENNRGEPYFVAFRALFHSTIRLVDKELDDYYKYNEIIDDIQFELEQLEKEGIDLFDFQLELKMALDKVKSGSFHMVDIYIEGLRPRIAAQWEKLGKKPKKREKHLVSSDELKEELAKAKQEMDKAKEDPLAAIKKAQQAQQGQNPTPPTASPPQPTPNTALPTTQAAAATSTLPSPSSAPTTQSPPVQSPSTSTQQGFSNLLAQAHHALSSGNREMLLKSYADLQARYKVASKDEKAQIFSEVKLLQSKLTGH